ncbi:MAG: hypothetical protein JWQ90_5324 [Hydrocarboniphaga sp.]|uniref:DUF6587 family protein n=1 Tax=Hydrocarboniphaga sp. TaxID=2033016 RepID=UPI0026153A60|nr:DUF6587 family protein [Hydrocarboniphaga sp.]MDB5972874.1 hypothetical protein [Hydrocarboniphaga sp.]
MTTSVLLQSLIVGVCVVVAGLYMLGRYAPKLVSVPRQWLARRLEQRGHARVASLVQPSATSGGGCHGGGDDACSSCGSCATTASKEQPLVFHRRR